ncbi:hypothetical protein DFP72DRAFT_839943 [Ephemerocybe angulata]|uniref:Uncharacterized protein n=1 Tax=Ephemerocybe angulata TaxID=980116 RepID=A0A8H6II81_9AGAR|nr:hypothetical protein DFP72DRAFT_839943 [Tulosesus angulatus]
MYRNNAIKQQHMATSTGALERTPSEDAGPDNTCLVVDTSPSSRPIAAIEIEDNIAPAIQELIDVDEIEFIGVVARRSETKPQPSVVACPGYRLDIPNPNRMYPFALHDHQQLPWEYGTRRGVLYLTSYGCEGRVDTDGEICFPCAQIAASPVVAGILNRVSNGAHSSTALSDHKRLATAIASGSIAQIDHIVYVVLRRKQGVILILERVAEAGRGMYHVKTFTEQERSLAALLWRLGGNRVGHIAHRALGLPSKQIQWSPHTNEFLGVCREHGPSVSLEFGGADNVDELFKALDAKEIHYASEAMIGAIGILCKDNRIYSSRPVLISGDCKKETGEQHAKVLQTVLDGVNSTKPVTNLRIVLIASDGEARRGSALVQLTFKHKLTEDSSIYPTLSPLKLMNFHVGDNDITHLRTAGASSAHLNALFNPNDLQDVKLAFDMLCDIWLLPPPTQPQDLSLSEQLEHLSAAAHLAFVLYKSAEKDFIPTLLYIDIILMIKNMFFCVAKAKTDTPHGVFFIVILGTDRLEIQFGILRTMVGNDCNLDILQISDRTSGVIDIADILAKHPDWDKGPRRMQLPTLQRTEDRTMDEMPQSSDHLSPKYLKGDYTLIKFTLQTCWRQGRRLAETKYPPAVEILKDDVDKISEALVLNIPEQEMPTTDATGSSCEHDGRLDFEDELDNLTSTLTTDGSAIAPIRATFERYIKINDKMVSKVKVLSMCSWYWTQTISGDRLKRVQEIERFSSMESSTTDALEADPNLLLIHDPIVMLVLCDHRIWLVLGKPLILRPATSDDNSTEKYSWRTFNQSGRSLEVPAASIEPLDPEVRMRDGKTFHLHQSTFLVATASLLLQRMQPTTLKNLPKMTLTTEFPYRERSGSDEQTDFANANTSECLMCTPSVRLNLSHGQRMLEHVACHILFDEKIDRTSLPCGLCLRVPNQCKYFIIKGRGAKVNFRIDNERSGGCMRSVNYVYGVAAQSTRTSPCSNVPLRCPLGTKAEPAVWRYNLEHHFADVYLTASPAEYSAMWLISDEEMAAMRKVWKEIKEHQRKGSAKRYQKSNTPKLIVSEAHLTQTIPRIAIQAQHGELEEPEATTVPEDGSGSDEGEESEDGGEQLTDGLDPLYHGYLHTPNVLDNPPSPPAECTTSEKSCGTHTNTDRRSTHPKSDAAVTPMTEAPVPNTVLNTTSMPSDVNEPRKGATAPGEQTTSIRRVRKRTRRFIEDEDEVVLNACICGSVVAPVSASALHCRGAGCKTEWYHEGLFKSHDSREVPYHHHAIFVGVYRQPVDNFKDAAVVHGVGTFKMVAKGASNNNPSSPSKGTTPGESDSESGRLNSQTKDPRSIEQGKARQRRDTRQQEQRHPRHSEFPDRVGKTPISAWAASDLDVSREAVSSAPGCPTPHGKRITGITGVSPSKCKEAPQRRVQAREG